MDNNWVQEMLFYFISYHSRREIAMKRKKVAVSQYRINCLRLSQLTVTSVNEENSLLKTGSIKLMLHVSILIYEF